MSINLPGNKFFSSTLMAPLIIFLSGIALATIGLRWWQVQIEQIAKLQFQQSADRVSTEVSRRFNLAILGLNGVKGMYLTHSKVSRVDFKNYVASLNLQQDFPGIRGFSFVEPVKYANLAAYTAAAKADGVPDFEVQFLTKQAHEEAYVVKYSEPVTFNVTALGLDIASEPRLYEGLMHAVMSGEAAISQAISMTQHQVPGVLLSIPLYATGAHTSTAEERKNALVGVLNATIVISELLNGILDVKAGNVDFELFDIDNTNDYTSMIYDADNPPVQQESSLYATAERGYSVTRILTLPGAHWALHLSSLPSFEASIDHSSPWLLFVTGILGSTLISMLLLRQSTGRYRAETLTLQMNEKLRQDEKRFRDFSESSADWFWETDAGHCFSYLSLNTPQMLGGQSIEELLGRSRLQVAAEDRLYSCNIWQAHAEVLAQRIPFRNFEYSLLDEHGKRACLSVSGVPVFDAAGAFAGYRGVGRVITEQQNTAEELERHRTNLELAVEARTAELASAVAQMRGVIESSGDGIIEVNTAGEIRLVNPSACRILGYRAEELIGRILHETIHHSHPDGQPFPVFSCKTAQAIANGKLQHGVVDTFWRADGSPVQVSISTQSIHDGKQVTGGVVNFSDISARMEVEQSREAARVAAERLARIKSEFLANMSHEIRTPLNGVLGMAQIGYRDSIASSRSKEIFLRIIESGKLLLGVINDILDFSKIEAGKLSVEAVPVDLQRSIDAAMSTFRERALDKGIALVVDLAADLPVAFLSDPGRLSQILLNLLSNAVKFTNSGEVRLSVRLIEGELHFSVTDTGIGIAEEQLGRLFQPFEQADNSTTRKYGGSGLGLVITRRLAELMNGSLGVTSRLASGSTFLLRLPCVAVKAVDGSISMTPTQLEQRLKGVRILAAEDNDLNQLVLEDLLVHEGAQLTMVSNGRMAVQAVRTNPYDVILMDVQMPQMDGLEATRHIRQFEPHLPVIGQTAHALAGEHAECYAAGMNDVITKPLDVNNLVSIVLRHLNPETPQAVNAPVSSSNSAESSGDFDWFALLAHFQGRQDFVEKLMQTCLDSQSETPSALRSAIQAQDFSRMSTIVHRFVGVASALQAESLSNFARKIEQQARLAQADALIEGLSLSYAIDSFLLAMRKKLDALKQQT